LCFFFRMRLRRFLMSEPMTGAEGSGTPETPATAGYAAAALRSGVV
jgi:hypothetical protein